MGLSYPVARWTLRRPMVERYDLYFANTKVSEQVTPEAAEQAYEMVMKSHNLHTDCGDELVFEHISCLMPLTSDTKYYGTLSQSGRPVVVSGSRLPMIGSHHHNASERAWISFYSIGSYWLWENKVRPSTELVHFAEELKPEMVDALRRLDQSGGEKGGHSDFPEPREVKPACRDGSG